MRNSLPFPCKHYGAGSKLARATNSALKASGGNLLPTESTKTGFTPDPMHYVVTKRFADVMRGEKSSKSDKGSIYAVFATRESAQDFIFDRKLMMVATVVSQ